jgi:PAS domain S-box-containing protein
VIQHTDGAGSPEYLSIVTRDLTEREQAEQRIAALLRISHRLNSTLDQDALLDELVKEALLLVGADGGCAGVRVGDTMRSRTYHFRDRRVDFQQAWESGQGLPGWVLEHRAPYLSNDVRQDPQSREQLDDRFQVRQALCLPIQGSTGEVLGFFEIHNKLVGQFEPGDVELMRAVARSAAVALANALAYAEVQAARQQLSRFAAGLREIVGLQQEVSLPELTMDGLLNTLLNRLGRLVAADGAVIEFREEEEMVYRAATGTAAGLVGMRLAVEGSFSGLCARRKESLVCTDAETDPRVDRESCRRVGLRSMVVVPFSLGAEVRGVLKVYAARPAAFSEMDRQLLEILSGLLGTSLQRKQAESGLQQSERDFRMLFASNPMPMWVLDRGTQRFLAVNDAAVRHYGYAREEFLQMELCQIMPAPAAGAPPPKGAEPDAPGESPRFQRHRLKDGTLILVETSSGPILFQERPALLVLANDVTKQKESEERIAHQARLLNLTSDAVIVRDMEGRVTFWNDGAERLYGWPRAEAEGRQVLDLIYRRQDKFAEALAATLAQAAWQGELEHFNRSGTAMTVVSRWTLVQDEEGAPQAVLVINTDITERKKLEEQFLRAQRLESIGTLAGGIAHDLNNILSPILMSIQLLRMRASDPQFQALLNTLQASAERGASIVKQVLTFARGTQGERVPLQLKYVLRELETVVADTFPKNITLEKRVPADLWPVLADSTQLHQVLLNLCLNARDAMPEGGRITIVLQNLLVDASYSAQSSNVPPGRYVLVEVADTGTGMPKEVQEKIFEPFFTTKEVGQGTGLGLPTVLAIIKSHGGTINVYSEPRKGTCFRVYLPALDTGTPEPSQEDDVASVPRGNGEGVLVVDDESSVRAIASQTLQAFGYRVFAASNGAEAVGVLAQFSAEIRVVLTDMMMPVMDGVATIRAAQRIKPGVIIIASSGLNENGHITRAASEGVKLFLPKPYDARRLLLTIHEALGNPPAPPAS